MINLVTFCSDVASFQRYTQPMVHALRNPAGLANRVAERESLSSPDSLLNQIRNMSTQQMVAAGVVGAEVLGFFTVGEMLGKMKIVGYRGDPENHEDH